MTESDKSPLESILRLCESATPEPWYPSDYSRESGVPRDQLDPYLEELRLGGLIRLTDWMQGRGQGYALTPEGTELLGSPRSLAKLREGRYVAPARVPMPSADRSLNTSRWDRGEAAREALLSDAPARVTQLLIYINILVWLIGFWMAWQAGVPAHRYLDRSTHEILMKNGAITGEAVFVRHEWWRMLTVCFVHIGLMHLGVNMYSLYVIGPLLERIWGSWRFLLLYLLAGLGGSCGMLLDTPFGICAGASGAIWGLLASFPTWIFLNREVLPAQLIASWKRQLGFVFMINIGITFLVPGISKGGHIGGGILGIIAAIPLDYLRFGKVFQRVLAAVALILIPVVSFGVMMKYTEPEREYFFLELECLPGIDKASLGAAKVYDDRFRHLYLTNAGRRDAEEVRKTMEAINDSLGDLRGEQNRLNRASFNSENFKEVRRSANQYLTAFSDLMESSRNLLEKGSRATEEDDKILKGQRELLDKATKDWRTIRRQLDGLEAGMK